MAWLQLLNKNANTTVAENSFKITPEQDLQQNRDASHKEIFCSGSQLIRCTVKRFPSNYMSESTMPPIYVYLKKFVWDNQAQDYLRSKQFEMSLMQYKAFLESDGQVGQMIDDKLHENVETRPPPPPYSKRRRTDDNPEPTVDPKDLLNIQN